MKHLFSYTLVVLLFASCTKKVDVNSRNHPDFRSLADTLSMTVADVVSPVLDDTDEDHRYYSAYYQLADATRAVMTNEILQYIHSQMLYKLANPVETETSAIYYEDLFLEFPELEANIDAYLAATDYGITYEYNDFASLAAAFVWQGEEEAPAIWIPKINDLPANYTPVVTDYIIATPIQIDLEDIDSEDRVFAWEYVDGEPTTISVGETQATAFAQGSVFDRPGAKGVFVTGTTRRKGPFFLPKPPYINTTPPYTTSVPSSGAAKINRIRIDQRYERNKKSEVKMVIMWGNYTGTAVYGSDKRSVHEVHRNDVNKDVWISPVLLCNYINNTDDLAYVYNLYEQDWVAGDYWSVGGIANSTTLQFNQHLYMKAEHSNEYYMCDRATNHQRNLSARIDHPVCYTIYTNVSILHNGKSTAQVMISNY